MVGIYCFFIVLIPLENLESPDEYIELSILEFLQGKDGVYKGMIEWMQEFFNHYCHCKANYFSTIKEKYLIPLILKRASGELPTNAQWIRKFVLNHKAYKKDSIVTQVKTLFQVD